jgi:alpha-ketoglutarate-dependent taurine dioxygenase
VRVDPEEPPGALGLEQARLERRQPVDPIADARERLAQRLGRVRILLERGADPAELDDRLAQLVGELFTRGIAECRSDSDVPSWCSSFSATACWRANVSSWRSRGLITRRWSSRDRPTLGPPTESLSRASTQ